MNYRMRHDDNTIRHDTDTMGEQRVSIREAAELLGVTSDAIRARLRRGTLRKETGPKGETIVILDDDTTPPVGDTTQHDADTIPTGNYVSAVEKQVEILRIELEARNRELAEMRRLLAGALERIPAIEAPPDTLPPEPRESSVTASEPRSDTQQVPQKEQPSWWRRLIGG